MTPQEGEIWRTEEALCGCEGQQHRVAVMKQNDGLLKAGMQGKWYQEGRTCNSNTWCLSARAPAASGGARNLVNYCPK